MFDQSINKVYNWPECFFFWESGSSLTSRKLKEYRKISNQWQDVSVETIYFAYQKKKVFWSQQAQNHTWNIKKISHP